MTDIPFNRRLFSIVLWIFCGLALLVPLTSCIEIRTDPAAPQTVTPVPSATGTAQPSPSPTASPLPSCTVSTGIEVGRLNIRTGAGVQHAVIRVLHESDVLTMTGKRAGRWAQVVTRDSLTGWINSRYCQKGK
jgi:uncharacterized protein YgiM (DUF1202 family)